MPSWGARPSAPAQPRTPRSTASTPPPPPSRQTPVKATAPPPRAHQKVNAGLDHLLQDTGQLLLYRAPSHTSFIVSSYLFGSLLILGAAIQASFLVDQRQMRWYVQLPTAALSLVLAATGTAFILGPSKMIRTISLVRAQSGSSPFLRFHSLPVAFGRGRNTFDAPFSQVRLDKAIHGSELPAYRNVDLQHARRFSDSHLEAAGHPRPRMSQRLGAFKNHLVNIWPTFWWDTRRMFLRDGMIYVRIAERGDWKLDLHNAELLDHAKPLTTIITPSALDRSVYTRFRNLAGS